MITTRIALLGLVARHNMNAVDAAGLWRIAGFDAQPKPLLYWLKRGLGITGAALVGLAVIFWIAANWHMLTRLQQFGVLQALVLTSCVAAALLPAARAAFGLLSLLSIGALFAYFGQTYQTGADPWQLFALWAVLSLPLGLTSRSDVVWSAWVVVAFTAIALWYEAQIGPFTWDFTRISPTAQVTASITSILMTVSFNKRFRRYSGAGPFAFGIALTLSCILISTNATVSMMNGAMLHYWFAVALLGACAAVFLRSAFFDIFAASVIGLALNFLLVGGLAWLLLENNGSSALIGTLLVLGLAAAGLLGITVATILATSRRHLGRNT